MKNTWNAFQIVMSNGAYGGKTVRFMTEEGLVSGVLLYAIQSEVTPGSVVFQIENHWITIPGETLVEVL